MFNSVGCLNLGIAAPLYCRSPCTVMEGHFMKLDSVCISFLASRVLENSSNRELTSRGFWQRVETRSGTRACQKDSTFYKFANQDIICLKQAESFCRALSGTDNICLGWSLLLTNQLGSCV